MVHRIILFLVLTIGLTQNGQGQSTVSYERTNYVTVADVKKYALDNNSWGKKLVKNVNHALSNAGESLDLTERDIPWIFNHISYEYSGEDMAPVFRYGRCSFIVFETRNSNQVKLTCSNTWTKSSREKTYASREKEWSYEAPKLDLQKEEGKKKFRFGPLIISASIATFLGQVIGGYFIWKNQQPGPSSPPEDTGSPVTPPGGP